MTIIKVELGEGLRICVFFL